jgi:FkbM family methyltransferase
MLYQRQVPIKSFLVDREFLREDYTKSGIKIQLDNTILGVPVNVMEDYKPKESDLVIVAIRSYNRETVMRLSTSCQVLDEDVFSVHYADEVFLDTYDFISEHIDDFQAFYESLGDDKSRIHMTAFFNQKVSGKLEYLRGLWQGNQYFDSDLVDFSQIKSVVDCGAYDGDSYKSFLTNYKAAVSEVYDGDAYLLEPDEKNFKKLSEAFAASQRVRCLCLGAWDKKETLHFSMNGTSSGISDEGEGVINVDSIDNIVGGADVDFIKMDIEGSELNALKGAKNTIRKYKPILAICVYHKKNDLLTIPKYIHSLCPEYKFYLRAHSKFSQELVLYAV